MAVNYITINDMSRISDLRSTDKILVARESDASTGYTTYQCTLQALSSAISCDVSSEQKGSILIDTLNAAALNTSAAAPTGRVMLSVYNRLKTVENNYISKNETGNITLAGKVTFSQSPSVPDVAAFSDVYDDNVVNVASLKKYAGGQSSSSIPMICGGSPSKWVYSVVNKNADDIQVYYNQSQYYMKLAYTLFKNTPIIHKCVNTGLIVVSIKGSNNATPLAIFTCVSSSLTDDKQSITKNKNSIKWNMLGYITPNTGAFHIYAKAGAYLAFYTGYSWSTASEIPGYIPNRGSFTNGVFIVVEEYS